MSSLFRTALVTATAVLGFALVGCSTESPDTSFPTNAPAPTISAREPLVSDRKAHAENIREDLVMFGYKAGQPVDYITVSGEVVKAVIWSHPNPVEDKEHISFYLDSEGVPISMTDGKLQCDFTAGIPETVFGLQTTWLSLDAGKQEIINGVSQHFWFTCGA